MTNSLNDALGSALNQASPVPEFPSVRIHAAAMDAFPSRKPVVAKWTLAITACAATVVLGFGGFIVMQSFQASQKALTADADAFAEQLLSESF